MPSRPDLTQPVLERLPRYYHYIQTQLLARGQDIVSSSELADVLTVDDTVTRRDMSAIGVKGQPKVGFRCREVQDAIRRTLGFGREVRAVLVGAGRLGGAIAAYEGFAEYGLRIVGVFDSSPVRIWEMVGGLPVRPVPELEDFLSHNPADMAVITVPAAAAQEIADRLASAGIRAIWNFAPVHLRLPPHVLVRNELMSVGLAQILRHLAFPSPGQSGRNV